MKTPTPPQTAGFSLVESMVTLSVASMLLAAVITASITLQKSFRAADNYFATHIQQVRIIDYLGRDVKRGLFVTTSVNKQTVTLTVPNYLIKAGDPEAIANPALIDTPRTPTITRTARGPQVNYGPAVSTVVYSVDALTIKRTENGVVTTIASSTDQLVPLTTNVELANTQYTSTTVTFQPMFTSVPSTASRFGTVISSTAYLRNRRRA
jgi:prepilin-type N-terminal cleavage/methylation domain-containing protein